MSSSSSVPLSGKIFSGNCCTGKILNFLSYLLALRMKYMEKKQAFLEENISVKEPITLFKEWLEQALQTEEILEPNAACLATVSR